MLSLILYALLIDILLLRAQLSLNNLVWTIETVNSYSLKRKIPITYENDPKTFSSILLK